MMQKQKTTCWFKDIRVGDILLYHTEYSDSCCVVVEKDGDSLTIKDFAGKEQVVFGEWIDSYANGWRWSRL